MYERTRSAADRLFNKVFNGQGNFMTPNIIRAGGKKTSVTSYLQAPH